MKQPSLKTVKMEKAEIRPKMTTERTTETFKELNKRRIIDILFIT